MSKKLTIDLIKSEFEKDGYILLSKEYTNSRTKLNYICPEGHKHSISWDNWKQNKRCPICAGQVKPTIDFIRSSFEKENYTLLSKEYINAHTKLKYICPKGHKHSIRFDHFKAGHRCPYCAGRPVITIDEVKSSFEKEGYTLLSKKYINAHTKLDYVCPNNHEHSIKLGDWKNGVRCPTCYRLNNFGPNHPCWKGGISFEPYCPVWTDKEFKEEIKTRDNYKCQNPDCYSKQKDDLTIHHIDYDKKNCNPNNLITVCRSCNSRANKDREWHKSWYQAVVYNKQILKKNYVTS